MTQQVRWVSDTTPPHPGQYLVWVRFEHLGYRFRSLRDWTGERWRHSGPDEIIERFLDGLID